MSVPVTLEQATVLEVVPYSFFIQFLSGRVRALFYHLSSSVLEKRQVCPVLEVVLPRGRNARYVFDVDLFEVEFEAGSDPSISSSRTQKTSTSCSFEISNP